MLKPTTANVLAALVVLAFSPRGDLGAAEKVSIRYDRSDPRIEFAVGDLRKAIRDAGARVVESAADRTIVFDTFQPGMGPQ